MTTLFKSGGKSITPNNLDKALLKRLTGDGWTEEAPEGWVAPKDVAKSLEDALVVIAELEEKVEKLEGIISVMEANKPKRGRPTTKKKEEGRIVNDSRE